MDTRLIIFAVLYLINNVFAQEPTVETTLGTIRGVRSSDGITNQYMGIPYATVNQSNPFGAAIPYPGFDGIFEANDDSSRCPQIEEFNHTLTGDLDCLHINVYTPSSANASSRLPVYVFIHGGAYRYGFNGRYMFGPKFFVKQDIILVILNYRLGLYGFMCLDIPEVPGNQGLKDTLLGLRWVQNHIESFGGDPNKVTIGGNSAGGVSVDYYMMRVPNGETLFHRGILHSGTVAAPFLEDEAQNSAVIIANHLGCETNDVYKALEFIVSVPPLDIVQITADLGLNVGPCVEKEFDGVEPFLSNNMSSSVFYAQNVSIMIGSASDEAQLYVNRNFNSSAMAANNVLNQVFDTLHENFTGAEAARSFYFGDQELRDEILRSAITMTGDFVWIYPVHRSIQQYLKNNAKNVYFFIFDYVGGRNFAKIRENMVGGRAAHDDDLGYLFDMEFLTEEPTPEDQLIVDKMTTMWANFVKYGDPTPQMTDLLNVKWERVTETSPLHCMLISDEVTLINRPYQDRMTFIELLYEINEDSRRPGQLS